MRYRFYSKIVSLFILIICVQTSYAQQSPTETINTATNITTEQKDIINLSKKKWEWMADKNVDTLNALFHEKAVFVHMGGSMTKEQELGVIKSGGIHYKQADIHEVSVNIMGTVAILLNRITLLAVVGGNEVTNPFMVTEVYLKEGEKWKLGSMSFTRLLTASDR